ncbi:hypothetical protein L1787_23970 [Acuticoccus sp. M5D2P5]|uniref:hypothetical protein n=1 Tax=Acuticoccus kalidii TaxID=2910977 RepID=UPI001F21DEB2|nr:hypothetical protein [Acuticoccus kalidii]MCF3936455.1 hypothetical protein [Acuticoccus kalidii]
MIVFLQAPMGPGSSLFDMLTAAMPAADIAWVGRSIRLAELREGLPGRSPKIVGGPFGLAAADGLKGVRLFMTVLSDPVARTVHIWENAARTPDHPFHEVPHTLTLREAIEEDHPFRHMLCNGLTRTLTPANKPPSAGHAMEALRTMPFLIGHPSHPRVFADALGKQLGLARGTIDPRAFRLGRLPRIAPDVRKVVSEANGQDMSLLHAIAELQGEAKMLRTGVAA